MTTISYTEFSKDPQAVFAKVDSSDEPVRITRPGKVSFILFPESSSWQETIYLLSSKRNSSRLLEATKDFQAGKHNFQIKELLPDQE